MPRRNRSPQRQRRLPPAAPVSPPAPPPPSPPPAAPDDLHFRTGIMGWLALIFARMRAAGDPYDQTLVLPALITIIIMNLNHVKGFPDWTVAAAIAGTAFMSGAWLGASLGTAGGFRAMLRSISVGAIETAIAFLIYGNFERPAIAAYQLIFLNFFVFWIIHHFVGVLRDTALTTEREWQATIPRRAFIDRWFRLVFRPGELKEEPNFIFIAAWVIKILFMVLIYVWIGWEFLEISPREALRILFLKGKVVP
jgi:hypothetical protein